MKGYKIEVHIHNEDVYMDGAVSVLLTLPAIPRVGETLYLGSLVHQLEDKARSSLRVAEAYAPKWFYRESYECDTPTEHNLKDLDFGDAIHVSSVAYCAGEDVIHIELDCGV